MRTFALLLVVTLMFCFIPNHTFAQDVYRRGACKADYEKFCKKVRPGQGRIAKCMKKHDVEISLACKEQLDADREKAHDFIKACKPDAEKYCKNVKPGQGRIVRCLKLHHAELSIECRAHFKK